MVWSGAHARFLSVDASVSVRLNLVAQQKIWEAPERDLACCHLADL